MAGAGHAISAHEGGGPLQAKLDGPRLAAHGAVHASAAKIDFAGYSDYRRTKSRFERLGGL
jgi:hypothetical protein